MSSITRQNNTRKKARGPRHELPSFLDLSVGKKTTDKPLTKRQKKPVAKDPTPIKESDVITFIETPLKKK